MARRPARAVERWDAHPVLAWWVRVGVLLVPLVVAVLVALAVIALLPDPEGVAGDVAWWVAVVGSAYGAALLVDRLGRRALPLAVLLRLSLVFPDRAPSRLRTARRTSLREIEHQVAALHTAGVTGGPAEAARTLVSLVGALGLHDKRTRGHSERVRAYVDMLTEEMGLAEQDRMRLRWAALLHDIGKLSVPGSVLNGGRELPDDDWVVLRRHPVEGDRLASALRPWLGVWGRCIREHHERWDGSGYPQGLTGTEISLGARIVAVADAYEVMTANRSYQAAVGATAARQELARCAGKDFDPAVVRAFLQVSIGRLRGVLGLLGFLPALPFAAAADRAGQAARGLTTVAAVSAVALAVSGSTGRPPPPFNSAPGPTVPVPSGSQSPTSTEAPTATPTPTRTPTPVPRVAVPSGADVARRSPTPAAAAVVTPAALARVLFLAAGGHLVGDLPVAGRASVPHGAPVPFGIALSGRATLSGIPHVVLFHELRPRHGRGQPRAVVSVALADCVAGSCHTLSSGSAALARTRTGYAEQSVTMSALDAVVAAGHVLQVSVVLLSHDNVAGLVVAYGGTTPSRLVLG